MADKKAEESKKPVNPPTTSVTTLDLEDDDDYDDLDDLDDVLDEFAAVKLDSSASAAAPSSSSSGPGRPSATASKAPTLSEEDDFAKQLQAGMAELLGELETSPEMQKQFEELVKELGDSVNVPSSSAGPKPRAAEREQPTSSGSADKSFQDAVRKTMERMQESGDQASAAVQSDHDDILMQMLKEMEAGGSEEDISKMIMGMMEELTNREVLYEPMKELHEKFPSWLENNKSKVDKNDLERYEKQAKLVKEIVEKFEEKGYSDSNAGQREYIVDRMSKMQAAGSPPPDLVGDLNAAQEALGEIDSGCAPQ